ncbi:MAG: hydrogenase nickel incorporation protein HypB [Betaproteobacteria bacterium]|nr:hydrogenase nickel incorporation protein HypB [Betaproteobacteria bacterium]
MCTVCGCGEGEVRIEGGEHAHVREDGTVFRHVHGEGAHDHGKAPVVGRFHEHPHTHADGSTHAHAHVHAGEHGHTHETAEAGAPAALHYGLGPAAAHAPGLSQERMVQIETDILGKNNALAEINRNHFAAHGVFAINLVSSPGSGKTTLLVKTLERLAGELPAAVIEGDQQTSVDAERIRATGVPAIQVNTGKGCHLDASMVGQAFERLPLAAGGLLLIENVGNLVCPADFDLGEAHKVVILSVTEGEDKPLKYPNMFRAADLMIVTKVDLLPHLSFDLPACLAHARRVNPRLEILQLAATTGEGLDAWLAWLRAGCGAARARAHTHGH